MRCATMWMDFLNSFGAPKEPYHLLAPHNASTNAAYTHAIPADDPDFPAYIVDVTRNALLSFTTSLTKASSQAHDFFSKLGQYFAFERMMRNCFGWVTPHAPSSIGLSVPQWPVPQWLTPPPLRPQPQPRALPWWGTEFLAPRKAEPAPHLAEAAMTAAGMPMFGAMLAIPAAFLSLAPAMMKAWGLPG